MYFIDVKVNMSFHLNPILKVTYLELVTMTQTYIHQKHLKVWLLYKTVITQRVPSEAEVKNFLISWESHVTFFRYLFFCISDHLMNLKICDVLVSISSGESEHFWIYISNHTSWSHDIWSSNRCDQGQYYS